MTPASTAVAIPQEQRQSTTDLSNLSLASTTAAAAAGYLHILAAEYYPKRTIQHENCDAGEPLPFDMVAGESIEFLCKLQANNITSSTSTAGSSSATILALSNYRLFVKSAASGGGIANIPVRMIDSVELAEQKRLLVWCKQCSSIRLDFETVEQCIDWHKRLSRLPEGPAKLEDLFAFAFYAWRSEERNNNSQPLSYSAFRTLSNYSAAGYYYHHSQSAQTTAAISLFSLEHEAQRLGFRLGTTWRVSDINIRYDVSSTYPKQHIVPANIDDNMLKTIAKYRSGGRFPSIAWRHPHNGAVLARSSQPEVGWFGYRNVQDELLVSSFCSSVHADRSSAAAATAATTQQRRQHALSGNSITLDESTYDADETTTTSEDVIDHNDAAVATTATVAASAAVIALPTGDIVPPAAVCCTNNNNVNDCSMTSTTALVAAPAVAGAAAAASTATTTTTHKALLIIDARSYSAAMANRVKGGGVEMLEYYTDCDVQFMGLGNIHVLRKSLIALRQVALCYPDTAWLQNVETSKWLSHVAQILKSALVVVKTIVSEQRSCLVHCTDGWDRTPLIVALAMIMMDSHYRTIRGFQQLIERQWIQFGHKFADRCGHNVKTDYNETSPIFLIWLDCIWQLTLQFPCDFEFNEAYLIHLAHHAYSCMFGTFLCNSTCERERISLNDRTYSLWAYMEYYADECFSNLLFVKRNVVLWLNSNQQDLQLWQRMYFSHANPLTATIYRQPQPQTTAAATNVLTNGRCNGQQQPKPPCCSPAGTILKQRQGQSRSPLPIAGGAVPSPSMSRSSEFNTINSLPKARSCEDLSSSAYAATTPTTTSSQATAATALRTAVTPTPTTTTNTVVAEPAAAAIVASEDSATNAVEASSLATHQAGKFEDVVAAVKKECLEKNNNNDVADKSPQHVDNSCQQNIEAAQVLLMTQQQQPPAAAVSENGISVDAVAAAAAAVAAVVASCPAAAAAAVAAAPPTNGDAVECVDVVDGRCGSASNNLMMSESLLRSALFNSNNSSTGSSNQLAVCNASSSTPHDEFDQCNDDDVLEEHKNTTTIVPPTPEPMQQQESTSCCSATDMTRNSVTLLVQQRTRDRQISSSSFTSSSSSSSSSSLSSDISSDFSLATQQKQRQQQEEILRDAARSATPLNCSAASTTQTRRNKNNNDAVGPRPRSNTAGALTLSPPPDTTTMATVGPGQQRSSQRQSRGRKQQQQQHDKSVMTADSNTSLAFSGGGDGAGDRDGEGSGDADNDENDSDICRQLGDDGLLVLKCDDQRRLREIRNYYTRKLDKYKFKLQQARYIATQQRELLLSERRSQQQQQQINGDINNNASCALPAASSASMMTTTTSSSSSSTAQPQQQQQQQQYHNTATTTPTNSVVLKNVPSNSNLMFDYSSPTSSFGQPAINQASAAALSSPSSAASLYHQQNGSVGGRSAVGTATRLRAATPSGSSTSSFQQQQQNYSSATTTDGSWPVTAASTSVKSSAPMTINNNSPASRNYSSTRERRPSVTSAAHHNSGENLAAAQAVQHFGTSADSSYSICSWDQVVVDSTTTTTAAAATNNTNDAADDAGNKSNNNFGGTVGNFLYTSIYGGPAVNSNSILPALPHHNQHNHCRKSSHHRCTHQQHHSNYHNNSDVAVVANGDVKQRAAVYDVRSTANTTAMPTANDVLFAHSTDAGGGRRVHRQHHEQQHDLAHSSSTTAAAAGAVPTTTTSHSSHVLREWIPDRAATSCHLCGGKFWLGKRKHHCRKCGRVFCSACSDYQCPLPEEYVYQPVRVCRSCYVAKQQQQQQSSSATASTSTSNGFVANGHGHGGYRHHRNHHRDTSNSNNTAVVATYEDYVKEKQQQQQQQATATNATTKATASNGRGASAVIRGFYRGFPRGILRS